MMYLMLALSITCSRAASASGCRELAEEYCAADYNAVSGRFDWVKDEKPGASDLGPLEFYCPSHEAVIVTTWRLLTVECAGNAGKATVAYQRVGRATREDIVAEPTRVETIEISLTYSGERWWVSRPPIPHVSPEALSACLGIHLRGFDERWWAKASQSQRQFAEMVQRKATSLDAIIRGFHTGPAVQASTPAKEAEEEIKGQVVQAARRFLDAVKRRDVDGILGFVSANGLRCTDEYTNRRDLAAELRTPGTAYHGLFFDTEALRRYSHSVPPDTSLLEMIEAGGEMTLKVVFWDDFRGALFAPCVYIQTAKFSHVPQLCFHKEKGLWRLWKSPAWTCT